MVMQWAHLTIGQMLSRLRACQCCHLHYVAQYRRTRSRLRTVVCWTRKWHHLLQRRVSGRGLINQLHTACCICCGTAEFLDASCLTSKIRNLCWSRKSCDPKHHLSNRKKFSAVLFVFDLYCRKVWESSWRWEWSVSLNALSSSAPILLYGTKHSKFRIEFFGVCSDSNRTVQLLQVAAPKSLKTISGMILNR